MNPFKNRIWQNSIHERFTVKQQKKKKDKRNSLFPLDFYNFKSVLISKKILILQVDFNQSLSTA